MGGGGGGGEEIMAREQVQLVVKCLFGLADFGLDLP